MKARDSTGDESHESDVETESATTAVETDGSGGRNWRRIGAGAAGVAALLALRRFRSTGGTESDDEAEETQPVADATESDGGGRGVGRKLLAATVVAAGTAAVGRVVRGRRD